MKFVARAVFHALDRLCQAVHWTPIGCGLINRTIYLGYDEDRDECRWEIPNRVLYPLWCWAMDRGWPEHRPGSVTYTVTVAGESDDPQPGTTPLT